MSLQTRLTGRRSGGLPQCAQHAGDAASDDEDAGEIVDFLEKLADDPMSLARFLMRGEAVIHGQRCW